MPAISTWIVGLPLGRIGLALEHLPVWIFPGLPELFVNLGRTCLNLIAQLDFFPHFSE